jgi:NADPH:quinone reductase-like Zn-dependent oxidoreductase
MFTRSLFQTPDMIEQHNLLGRVAALIDEGVLKTTLSKVVPELTPLTLARAHAELEAGRMVGKLVIDMSGFHR